MKNTVKRLVTAALCMVLTAAFLFSGTAEVQASSTWKKVRLNDSCADITELSYPEDHMELSEDKTELTFYYAPTKDDGTDVTSINVKKYLPENILKKFADEEVYVYRRQESVEGGEMSTESATKAMVADTKKYITDDDTDMVTVDHYDSFLCSTKTKHKKGDEGWYIIASWTHISSKKGTGKVKVSDLGETFLNHYCLADRNGKKIINIVFHPYEASELDGYKQSTSNLAEIKGDYNTIYLKAGSSLSEKLSVTGTVLPGDERLRKISYDSRFLTISKSGKMTAKDRYGITNIDVAGITYSIVITDGTKKMKKALDKAWADASSDRERNVYYCTLTVGKDGKYTIKRDY